MQWITGRQKRLTPRQLQQALYQLTQLNSQKVSKRADHEQEKIAEWFKNYTAQLNLSTLTREDVRIQILDSLSDEPIRSHLLELSIAFYAYGGDTDNFEDRLVNSLVAGLQFEGRNPKLCELPQEILASGPLTNFPWSLRSFFLPIGRVLGLTQELSLREYLLSNRHIQLVMLAALAEDLDFPQKTE